MVLWRLLPQERELQMLKWWPNAEEGLEISTTAPRLHAQLPFETDVQPTRWSLQFAMLLISLLNSSIFFERLYSLYSLWGCNCYANVGTWRGWLWWTRQLFSRSPAALCRASSWQRQSQAGGGVAIFLPGTSQITAGNWETTTFFCSCHAHPAAQELQSSAQPPWAFRQGSILEAGRAFVQGQKIKDDSERQPSKRCTVVPEWDKLTVAEAAAAFCSKDAPQHPPALSGPKERLGAPYTVTSAPFTNSAAQLQQMLFFFLNKNLWEKYP